MVIRNNIKKIEQYAFYNCAFTNIFIPKSVTNIGGKAFGYVNTSTKIPDFKIYCYGNSAAATYAYNNGFKFVDISI